jgi:methylase of polypeptide subunit release factors
MPAGVGDEPRSTVFGGLHIDYDASMLTPRPWTLAQSSWAAELLADAPEGPVLELCAGAGQIGLAAVQVRRRRLVAVELNPRACRHLRANAARAGLADLVEVRPGRVEEVLAPDEEFAVVVADPPWVRSADVARFPDDPVGTIDGGSDGLAIARSCVAVITRHLRPGGSAVLQLGTAEQLARLVAELPARLALVETRTHGTRGVLARIDAG